MYLEDFKLFNIRNPSKPLSVPGLSSTMKELYRQSDYEAYIKGSKTHIGFTTQNFLFSEFKSNTQNFFNDKEYGSDINAFIDVYTALIPFSSETKPGTRLYGFTLNPDNPNISSFPGNPPVFTGNPTFQYPYKTM